MPLHLPTNSDSLSLKGLNQSSDFFERVLSSLLSHYPHGCQTPNATPRCCTLGILVLLFWLCQRGGCSPALYSHGLGMGMHVIIFKWISWALPDPMAFHLCPVIQFSQPKCVCGRGIHDGDMQRGQ